MGSSISRETLNDDIAMTSLRSNHIQRKLSRGGVQIPGGCFHSHFIRITKDKHLSIQVQFIL